MLFRQNFRKIKKNIVVHFTDYFLRHLYFDNKERRWSFISVPKEIMINGISSSQILDALNNMLRIIFTYTTNFSYTIHFVNKEATSDIRLKEKIEAFSNFQQFFNISKLKIFKIF